MMNIKQLIVYTDGYGAVIFDKKNQKPNPYFEAINEYLNAGWTVKMIQGSGMAGYTFNRGGFCILLESEIT